MLLCTYFLATSSTTHSISPSSIWADTAVILSGFGIASNSRSAEQKPYYPTVQLLAKSANNRHYWSLVRQSVPARIPVYENQWGAWYMWKTSMTPGVSIRASSRGAQSESANSFISFDLYDNLWSGTRWSGGARYQSYYKSWMVLHLSLFHCLRLKEAVQRCFVSLMMWITDIPSMSMVATRTK